jgi:hypothetical protein
MQALFQNRVATISLLRLVSALSMDSLFAMSSLRFPG